MPDLPPIVGYVRMDVAQAIAGLEAVKTATVASTDASRASMNQWNKETSEATGAVATGLLAVGAGLGIAAVASVKMAADFEASTTRLITSAGETQANIGMVRQGILDMAGQVGDSAQQLATAMYMVDSANIHGADSLVVLRAAAEGAKAENADLTTVVDAVTSAMADYHLGADQSALVTSRLITAVSMGKTTFENLTGAMHSVLPIASAAHISMSDILGDLASMTEHGISADQATQNLAHTIQHLQTTTAPQNKELALLGLNAQQLSADLGTKGLSGTLQEISNAIEQRMGPDGKIILEMQTALAGLPPEVQKIGAAVIDGSLSMRDFTMATKDLNVEQAGLARQFATLMTSTHGIGSAQKSGAEVAQTYAAALKAATGDSTTLNTALMLTGENASYTNQAVRAVSGAATEAGGNVQGWAVIQSTFNNQMDRAKDGLEAAAIAWGTRLLPMASQALAMLAAHIPDIIAVGNRIIDVAIGVGRVASALGPFLPALSVAIALFIAWRTAMTIGAAIEGVVVMVQAFAAGLAVLSGTEGIATAAQWALNIAMDANPIGLVILAIAALIAIIVLVVTHWQQLRQWIINTAQTISSFIAQHQVLAAILIALTGPIGLVVAGAAELITHWSQVTSAFWSAWNAVTSLAGALRDAAHAASQMPVIGGLGQALGIPGFAEGGIVPGPVGAPRLILAHGGERVQTPEQQTTMGPGMDDTNELLALLYQLLDDRLPRGGAALSTRAYGRA